MTVFDDFLARRSEQNNVVMRYADRTLRRFYNVDTNAYLDGALPAKTKELLGLATSLALRCDDCVTYHLARCRDMGVSDQELMEALDVAVVVGGSITIPHLRRALSAWDEVRRSDAPPPQIPEPSHGPLDAALAGELVEAVRNELAGWAALPPDPVATALRAATALHRVCALLADAIPWYHWVGFYLIDPSASRDLVLGPFVGAPTRHVRIPVGTGVCGQAAESKQTLVIQDVSAQNNYLACSVDVRAEVVVPLLHDRQVVGELDIDSHDKAVFTQQDRALLEAVAAACVPLAKVLSDSLRNN